MQPTFETGVMLLTFVTGGKMMEAYAKGRTGDALKGLMELRVEEVRVCKNRSSSINAAILTSRYTLRSTLRSNFITKLCLCTI